MYESRLKGPSIDRLCEAILSLRSEEECYRLFEDLLTVSELQSLAQRLEVACLLRQGVTYHIITERTGASTATISRVNRCLTYGADGYNLVLERLPPLQDPPTDTSEVSP